MIDPQFSATPATEKPSLVFLDEFAFYAAGQDDGIKEALRSIEGVPNATYLVKDGLVFVFNKLVDLVKKAPSSLLSDSLRYMPDGRYVDCEGHCSALNLISLVADV